MDHLPYNGYPGHDQPIDQERRHRAAESERSPGPLKEEYYDHACCCEYQEFFKSFHLISFHTNFPLGRNRSADIEPLPPSHKGTIGLRYAHIGRATAQPIAATRHTYYTKL